ncbi:RHO1 GDP-GTP exchange protein 2 [Apophysomyces ossiformis]|uniref:RHO1 GDP-GTP exchange protein 2 n=1 Tax=Apophysomyces ossiformis TaxID=679940 RepID=A0A8H7ETF4_9FUNG|nr:RHO1 GDP-GTP exchange protein 2 [Apophysomyces ossiformis]
MSGQHRAPYGASVPPDNINGLVNDVNSYLDELSNNEPNTIPPRQQSLQNRNSPYLREAEYTQPQNNTSNAYYGYYGASPGYPPRQESRYDETIDVNRNSEYYMQSVSHDVPTHQRNASYGSEAGYPPYSYEGGYSSYGYPPPSYHYAPPTPMPSRSSYGAPYPQSTVVDPVLQRPAPPLPPSSSAYRMPMPVNYNGQTQTSPVLSTVYPPPDYQIHRTPPGSPGSRQSLPPNDGYSYQQQHQQPQQTPAYPPPGYSRPTSQDYMSAHRPTKLYDAPSVVSTPSSADPSSASSLRTHRRTPSSLKHTVPTTIERPKYHQIQTEGGEKEEIPFIPVSPDTSDDEELTFVEEVKEPMNVLPSTGNYVPSSLPPPLPPVHSHGTGNQEQDKKNKTEERDDDDNDEENDKEDYSLMSVMSKQFIRRIKAVEHVRDLFCANEYPEAFTGQEAVTALKVILRDRIPEEHCIKIAMALMHSTPALFSPVHYSQKSLITGRVYNSPDELYTFDEEASDEDVPVGVLTNLTKCYTFACEPDKGGCYAPQCPNKPEIFEKEFKSEVSLSRQASIKSTVSTEAMTSYPHMAWAQRVPRELLESVSKRERDRQEAINEMIYSEEVYRDDLDTLHEVFVMPLKELNIIERERRDEFFQKVFSNYAELRVISAALFKDLLELQHRYDKRCIPMIGDVLVQHFRYFEQPFTAYSPGVSLAEYIVGKERRRNPEFQRFISENERNNERMRRLAFRHFLLNPVTRMQRYPLLLEAIIKKTDEDNPDHAYLVRCRDVIKGIAARADLQADVFKKRVEILKIDDSLIPKQGELHDLQLTDESRKLYHQGGLKRRNNNIDVTEKSDIYAFVFDHVLVMTKPRKTSAGDEYRIWKRPIPLQMLFVQGSGEYMGGSRSQMMNSSTGSMLQGSGNTVSLTLCHLGQRSATYPFYCTPEERQQWIKAIEDAKSALKKRQGENDVFELCSLDDNTFRYIGPGGAGGGQSKVNCSVPFVTADGKSKVAIGTDIGVYVKTVGENTARRVLSCENVTQLAVMEKHHILLVLTDKSLKAYAVDMISSANNIRTDRLAQEIAQHVSFFQVGYCNSKDLLVYKKKKNTSSIFTALEPICDLRDPKNEKLLTQRTGFLGQRSSPSWFKKYKDFYVGADASNIHFLSKKLNIVCERGFEIIDPENLSVGRDIPDSEDPQFNFVQRHTDLKPLAMYRIHEKFLLCYNKFAFYVNNRNGSLVQQGSGRSPLLCEWEGNPDHIVYQHPYVVAIDPSFIEVRHVDTGELVQIVPGDNIRLTYYNGGGESPVIHGCMTHSQRPDFQHVFHLSLNPPRNSNSTGSRK